MPTHEQAVISFAPASTSTTSGNADQLDRAGQTILQLLNRAASVAEENSRNAIEMAQALSHKLRAAEGRIAELEAQAAAYQEQAERAEQWFIEFTQRYRTAFCVKTKTRVAARCNDTGRDHRGATTEIRDRFCVKTKTRVAARCNDTA